LEKVERSELSLLAAAFYRSNNVGSLNPGMSHSTRTKKPKKPHNTQRKITESKAYNNISPTMPITQAKFTRKKKQEKDKSQDKKAAYRNQILNDPYVRISRQGFLSIINMSKYLKENMVIRNVYMAEENLS